jgi:hypothetical protein
MKADDEDEEEELTQSTAEPSKDVEGEIDWCVPPLIVESFEQKYINGGFEQRLLDLVMLLWSLEFNQFLHGWMLAGFFRKF